MKTERPSCNDDQTLLHKHLIVPASIWTALLLAACAAVWFDSAPALPVASEAAPAASAPAGAS